MKRLQLVNLTWSLEANQVYTHSVVSMQVNIYVYVYSQSPNQKGALKGHRSDTPKTVKVDVQLDGSTPYFLHATFPTLVALYQIS